MPVEIFNGRGNAVAIFGAELVSQKIIDILVYAINNECDDEHGIHSIVFRDDGKPILDTEDDTMMWMCLPDSKSIVCNLKNCVHHTIRQSLKHKKEHYDVGLRGLVWHSILAGAFHEMCHSQSFIQDEHGDKLYSAMKATKQTKEIKEFMKKEEKKADDYAEQMLFALAKKIDLEVDFGESLSAFVNGEIEATIEHEEKHMKDMKSKRWVEYQKFMQANNGLYIRESDNDADTLSDKVVSEFKTYLHLCSGDPVDDTSWNTTTIGKPVTATETPVELKPSDIDYNNPAKQFHQPAPEMQATVAPLNPAEAEPLDPDDAMAEADFYILEDDFGEIKSPNQNTEAFNIMARPDAAPAQATAGGQMSPQYQHPAPQPQYTPPQYQAPTQQYQPAPQFQQPAPVNPGAVPYTPPQAGAVPNPIVPGKGAYDMPLDGARYQQAIKSLYTKLVSHIFEGCQFNPNYQPFFLAKDNIHAQIGLSADENLIVKEMVVMNAAGKRQFGTKVEGSVMGCFIDNAKDLPGYHLTMSSAFGDQIQRKIIPQNPHKTNKVTGQLSSTAQEAMNGAKIAWIVDPDTKEKQFSLRMYNGQLQTNEPGSWTNV